MAHAGTDAFDEEACCAYCDGCGNTADRSTTTATTGSHSSPAGIAHAAASPVPAAPRAVPAWVVVADHLAVRGDEVLHLEGSPPTFWFADPDENGLIYRQENAGRKDS